MDSFRIASSVISFVANSFLIYLILSIRLTYFASFKWYILALPINNILYTFTLLFFDVHHGTHVDAVFTAAFGIIPGRTGVGIYLAVVAHYYSTLFLLFLFRFSLLYNGDYSSSSLHSLLSSKEALLPTATFVLFIDCFYFSLPTYFNRPDSSAVDHISEAMKSFFNKGRDYGYAMQIIWIHGRPAEFQLLNCIGSLGNLFVFLATLLSYAVFARYIYKFNKGSSNKSKTRRIRERVIFRSLLTQVAVIYLGIGLANFMLTLFPLIPAIGVIIPPLSSYFRVSVVIVPAISPILLFLQLRDLRVVVYNWLMRKLNHEQQIVKIDKSTNNI